MYVKCATKVTYHRDCQVYVNSMPGYAVNIHVAYNNIFWFLKIDFVWTYMRVCVFASKAINN